MSRACAGCLERIQPEEMVMWIRDHAVCGGGETGNGNHTIYHARCFACVRCDAGRPLSAGEHYGIQDGRVYCRAHYCELQLELRQVRGDVWGPVATRTPTVRRTGMRGRPRKLRTAAKPPDNPIPTLCETAVTTAETEPRKTFLMSSLLIYNKLMSARYGYAAYSVNSKRKGKSANSTTSNLEVRASIETRGNACRASRNWQPFTNYRAVTISTFDIDY